jgi:hypothetical protein
MRLTASKKGDRFFRAMVLMGGSMALSCGGTTTRHGGDSSSGGGGSGGGSGGAGDGPGAGGTGGTGGAGILLTSSTTGVALSPVDPGPFPCVPAQFDCGAAPPECTYPGWRVPDNCRCDATRPKSAADCAPDQAFVCRKGTERWDGSPYTEPVPFECSCVATGSYCSAECALAYARVDFQCERVPSEGGAAGAAAFDTLCGCALVVLR